MLCLLESQSLSLKNQYRIGGDRIIGIPTVISSSFTLSNWLPKFVEKMIKVVSFLLQFAFIFSQAKSITLQPRPNKNFTLNYIQNVGSCSFTVVITTSCSSTSYTRDQISLSFGDAYGNQVYAPRLDDPSTRTFERCSSDTFQITGPCTYQVCYVYVYRSGWDGWKPDTVKIYGYNMRAVTFYYNIFIPGDVWYGFNLCSSTSSAHQQPAQKWFIYVILGFVLSAYWNRVF